MLGLAAFLFVIGGGSGGNLAYATDTKTITASNVSGDHECNSNEWHFIINQIDKASDAPQTIHVVWANGASEDVPLDNVTPGGAAHYTTTSNLGSTVVSATAVIYSAWSGQFVLSHGPCGTPTPSSTPTKSPTPTPSPSESESHSESPSPSTSPSESKSGTVTPSVGASTSTAPVPTSVPAGSDGTGPGATAGFIGLALVLGGAAVGTMIIGRRRGLHGA